MLQPLTMNTSAETGGEIENRTFDEISIGDSASLTRTLSRDDIALFAVMSGDLNPAHLDERYAAGSTFHRIIAHGMWGGALVSAVLGTRLPGPGTIYLGQDLRFRKPVGLGDTITVRSVPLARDRPRRCGQRARGGVHLRCKQPCFRLGHSHRRGTNDCASDGRCPREPESTAHGEP